MRMNGKRELDGGRVEKASNDSERQLLTAREAAAELTISERTLWTLTKTGEIPSVRIRRSVRYLPADLSAYVIACRERNP